MQRLRLIRAALVAAVLHAPAAAQTRDTVTVDATATLAAAPPVLSIEGVGNLRFGKVGAPGVGTQTCTYRLTHKANRIVLADGVVNFGDACAFQEENQSVGIALVTCEAGNSIAYSYAVESPLAARGVVFSVADEDIGYRADDESRLNVTACGKRQAELVVGGRIDVSRDFVGPDIELVIGRVLIDIYYEANPCQCG